MTLKKFMECIDIGIMTIRFVLTVTGWILTKDSKQRFNALHAIMHAAACDMRTLVSASVMPGQHMPHIEAVKSRVPDDPNIGHVNDRRGHLDEMGKLTKEICVHLNIYDQVYFYDQVNFHNQVNIYHQVNFHDQVNLYHQVKFPDQVDTYLTCSGEVNEKRPGDNPNGNVPGQSVREHAQGIRR